MLELLKYQIELGADECLSDEVQGALPPSVPSQGAPPQAESPQTESPQAESPPTPTTPLWESAESLEALLKMVESFEGCDLKKMASNTVFADGNPEARVMLIGEAPGADEDRQGKPFVGVSGQLLDRMLASIGLDRERVYISNIIPWRPPGNRTPTVEEAALFLPMIKRHIELIAPKIIVTLGGSSTKALLGTSEGILKLRGHWREYSVGGKAVPFMAMLHPAYLLRTPVQKGLAWQDLRALHRKMESLGL